MILKKDGFSRFVFGRIFRMVLILWLLVNIFSLFFRRKYFRVFKDREKIQGIQVLFAQRYRRDFLMAFGSGIWVEDQLNCEFWSVLGFVSRFEWVGKLFWGVFAGFLGSFGYWTFIYSFFCWGRYFCRVSRIRSSQFSVLFWEEVRRVSFLSEKISSKRSSLWVGFIDLQRSREQFFTQVRFSSFRQRRNFSGESSQKSFFQMFIVFRRFTVFSFMRFRNGLDSFGGKKKYFR